MGEDYHGIYFFAKFGNIYSVNPVRNSTMKVNYLTADKKKDLEEELARLSGEKRKEIIERLEYAKSLGDLSENAEYHQAREDQGKLEARIAQIEEVLRNSQVLEHSGADVAELGSTVAVTKEGEREGRVYEIVGPLEADSTAGRISHESPLGKAILGKKRGEKVTLATPGGATVIYKITKVS